MNYGVKAQNLIELQTLYPDNVPPFEMLPFESIIQSYPANIKKLQKFITQALDQDIPAGKLEAAVDQIFQEIQINTEALSSYHQKLQAHEWPKVSIRTSAPLEDGEAYAFAGQYVSFVDIPYTLKHLEKYAYACFRSLFSERVIKYAQKHHVTEFPAGGAVIVQKMFYGQKSGVLFTENGQGEITFAIADSWRNTSVEGYNARVINAPKTTLTGPNMTPSLQHIATIGLELENRYNHPLDIEWAYNSNTIMLLQMRPQTSTTTDYSLNWDGTNISENYPGVTLPLTYSFIRNLYSQVYPSFFRLMGMSNKRLRRNRWIFDDALGYINGHVYYRIDNWYELVRLIPGNRNQEFFEAMLNPAKKAAADKTSSVWKSALRPSFWGLTLRFSWLLLRSDAYSRSFAQQFAVKFKQYQRLNWSAMSAAAALEQVRVIREELMVLWGVPILNDIRVMIFHGLFKSMLKNDSSPDVYLEYLSGLTDRQSIKPLQALHALGQAISGAMQREGLKRVEDLPATNAWPVIKTSAEEFIHTFGGRTPDELQLENPRLGENIWDVIQLAYATKDADLATKDSAATPKLHQIPLQKRFAVRFVANQARRAIDFRERFRFNRAQVFGIARTAYITIGEKLALAKIIKHSEDIFWLTEQEIEAVIGGHSWSYDLRAIVEARKHEFESYSRKPFWLRVTGHGTIAPASIKDTTPSQPSSANITGLGVAPGRLTAPAVVVREFDPKLDVTDKILVIRHADPGWTLLLVQAAGVITEQGNPLSHVAIVAREIRVPAIVGVKNAVTTIKTGQILTIDGTNGEISIGS